MNGPARSYSLRIRVMIAAALVAVVSMGTLLAVLMNSFTVALEAAIEQRLSADAGTLISVAELRDGALHMPEHLPDDLFNELASRQLGYIFDSQGRLVWASTSARDESMAYTPTYDGHTPIFTKARDASNHEFYVYDVEIDLLRGTDARYSFVTMQPFTSYQPLYQRLVQQLYIWLGGALLLLLGLLALGLSWGLSGLRGIRQELDQVESGERDNLSNRHPREFLRLTGSLNRLLQSERLQRERYRHSLDDLAHSLKTPLAVLQGVSESLVEDPERREQARALSTQIERMSQQIDYQLQRASLRKSGLVRHRITLAEVVRVLCEALDKVYRDKGVRVRWDFPPTTTMPMERAALMELLGNLLENAYRLCLENIRIRAESRGGYHLLTVEDDGPGIPASQRERILRRGERADSAHIGQGIGTAVVMDIVESYGGELILGDSPLGGASFQIRLPTG